MKLVEMMAVLPARADFESLLVESPIPFINNSTFKEFEFQVGEVPGTHLAFPIGTIICYCVGIPLLQWFMKGRQSPPLKLILIFHNLFLTVISGFLLVFLLSTLWSFIDRPSPHNYSYFQVYCH